MKGINFQKWDDIIQTDPLWYVTFLTEIKEAQGKGVDRYLRESKDALYGFFEKHIKQNDLVLGEPILDWDKDRKAIDTIVIHHTQEPHGLTQERLSSITMLRLYVPYFTDPADQNDLIIKNTPIFSGHFRDGKQVFWPYHWLIRNNGIAERLLNDNEVGWQAGNWDANCRSVAITLDNDYENGVPSGEELDAVARIIKEHYPHVSKERIFGHREINLKTTCPSNLFLDSETQHGWKNDLLSRL